MNGPLFFDTPTAHRCLISGVRRVVHARHDHEGNFVRFVVLRTQAEIDRAQKAYLPARMGIASWFEVLEHNFTK